MVGEGDLLRQYFEASLLPCNDGGGRGDTPETAKVQASLLPRGAVVGPCIARVCVAGDASVLPAGTEAGMMWAAQAWATKTLLRPSQLP